MTFVFLPGMDGTGYLFEPILKLWKDKPDPRVISYPSDRVMSYDELLPYVMERLPTDQPYVIVAESFGGPLAARIAATHPPFLKGLVLSATFVHDPSPIFGPWSFFLIGSTMFHNPITRWVAKQILKAQGVSAGESQLLFGAIDRVPGRILAERLKEALRVQAYEDLRNCKVPVLCLYAERDLLLAKRSSDLIKKAYPAAQLVGLDTPHFLLQSKPAEALAAIHSFSKNLPQT